MNDIEKRKILEELGDIPEEIYDNLVGEFLFQFGQHLKNIDEASSTGDFGEVARIAHTIKGASSNLRLEEIARAADALEHSSRRGGPEGEIAERRAQLRAAARSVNPLV